MVGNFYETFEDFLQQTVTLHQVIRLDVTYHEETKEDEKPKERTKTLNLDNVHDLQSRLMLLGREKNVTEKDVQDVTFEKKYFVEVHDFIYYKYIHKISLKSYILYVYVYMTCFYI